MELYIKVLKQYADFSGRARRKEFWMFVLFNTIFAIGAMLIDRMFGMTIQGLAYGWICLIYSLAVLLPSLAVGVRRLHDIGKSGWYYIIALIPVAGWILLLFWFCKDGQVGENEYGLNPKAS